MSLTIAGPAVGEGRFIDNGDGTVTDSTTGLMWAQTDNFGHITWKQARLYSENIILGPYNDWRMPTAAELATLYDKSLPRHETVCGHHVRAASQVELSCGFVWSSDVQPVPGGYLVSAYAFNFAKGVRSSARMSQSRGYRALPVRTVSGDEGRPPGKNP